MHTAIPFDLQTYVETELIPQYRQFDRAHDERHARDVIRRSMELAAHYDVCPAMVYAIAACHDLGLRFGREHHHTESARLVRQEVSLRRWFTVEQIEVMADACEDHRASLSHEPRTIYGRIVAEADRLIDPEKVVRRTVQYSFAHFPDLSRDGHFDRLLEHLHEKYDHGGYLRLWLPESANAAPLAELRRLIHDETALRRLFERIYAEEQADGRSS